MNVELLNKAKTRVQSIPVLINMVSKRVRQLNAGFRLYIKPNSPNEEKIDIALREIVEGKLIAKIDFASSAVADDDKV